MSRHKADGRTFFCVAVIVSIAVVFCSDCMVKETNNHDILNSKAAESKSDLTNQQINIL